MDYSVVVGVEHLYVEAAPEHRRFFAPSVARQFYGADPSYLIVYDYPLSRYIEQADFVGRRRLKGVCGIVEISLRGEAGEQA